MRYTSTRVKNDKKNLSNTLYNCIFNSTAN